jgi:hypothetical protein
LKPPGQEKSSHVLLRRVYSTGVILAAVLFAFHTWVIFETAFLLSWTAGPAIKLVGVHVAGPLLILASFFVLFITHLLEAAVWALLFWKIRQFATFGEGLYFSGTSLTALGYGDIVLRPPWRGLGPVMATNGLLMFGCSTAFLFFVIQRIWADF